MKVNNQHILRNLLFFYWYSLSYAASFCSTNLIICFTAVVFNNSIHFDVNSRSKGWIGLGIGSSMNHAKIVMAYKFHNKTSITLRTSNGHTLPTVDTVQKLKILTPRPSFAPDVTHFSFAWPIDDMMAPMGNISMIYAYKDTPVQNNTLLFHDHFGVIPSINFFSNGSFAEEVKNSTFRYKRAHAILMFVSWYICPSIAVFLARFMKGSLGVWWFRLHFGLMSTSLVMSTIAMILIFVAQKVSFSGAHQYFGMTLFCLMFVQVFLGVFIDKLFNPYRLSIPWYDKIHWWLGRLLCILGIVTIFLGIPLLFTTIDYTPLMVGFGILVGITMIIFIVAEFKLGQVNMIERKSNIALTYFNDEKDLQEELFKF
jgi:hypothetical protein